MNFIGQTEEVIKGLELLRVSELFKNTEVHVKKGYRVFKGQRRKRQIVN